MDNTSTVPQCFGAKIKGYRARTSVGDGGRESCSRTKGTKGHTEQVQVQVKVGL